MLDLLDLPARSDKPRERGITHVLDKGLSLTGIDELVETAGPYVDLVKLGWGTAVVAPNLEAKLDRYRSHGIPVVLGGTLTEIAILQGKLDALIQRISRLGLEHVEISDGTITLAHEEKLALIEKLAKDFRVMSEVGSKDETNIMAPYRWIELIETELAAGAWKVITEARESGTVGIFRHDGEVRQGLVDEVAHAVPFNQLLFEAPRKDQQVWFVQKFGPNVNIGNIPPEEVISLETIRLGLRSDTVLDTGPAGDGAGPE
jgi:phosphosulfolactate synthase